MLIHENTAYTFNRIFHNKVKKLTRQTTGAPTIDPGVRLRKWLDSRGVPLTEFKLRPIDRAKLRKIIAKLKGNISCGIGFIDGYSVKLAAPVLEDVLLCLVNLNIEKSKYPQKLLSGLNPIFQTDLNMSQLSQGSVIHSRLVTMVYHMPPWTTMFHPVLQ